MMQSRRERSGGRGRVGALALALMLMTPACAGRKAQDPTATATPATSGQTTAQADTAPKGPGKLGRIPAVGEKITLTNAQWKEKLSSKEYYVLREQGTERAFTGDLLNNKAEGVYHCAACGAPLFSSKDKFKSGTGWPSYTKPVGSGRVDQEVDNSLGMTRAEVHCAACGGHLGHVFDDGPQPTGLRYCINSVSLDFVPASTP